MATYVEILRSEFPEIDSEVFDYITGVLDCGGADFVDGEEVFEAVGGVLQGVSADSKNEDDIRDICQQMFNTLKLLRMSNCLFPGRTEEEYRHQLGGYGITGELAVRPVASLSGGQKSRVAFAQMTMPCPNFYILDEPTNHLDMETIEALAKALNKFKGGVVLVSHDERLIRMVCKELWVCENGTVWRIDGGFDEYREILQEQFRKEGYL
ncbi:ATP-binding cassette sub-family F member 3 [Acipenser ruthenus]|uniref:ATP-binding cassette sub-family F member 3 n=1 Tax=Acipenser ruthenus TaxID=7906 RepID=A0A444U6L8_ACIRT|nr:ATP-binding cassette sub-family F member 3 [Acipenser ruthenus]